MSINISIGSRVWHVSMLASGFWTASSKRYRGSLIIGQDRIIADTLDELLKRIA